MRHVMKHCRNSNAGPVDDDDDGTVKREREKANANLAAVDFTVQ